MHEVVVTDTIDASRAAVEAALSPASIVEYAGTYEVESVEAADGAIVVIGATEDLTTVLEFTRTDGPFVYRQRDDAGPFAEMYTSVSLAGDEPVTVSVRSCYTFGLPLARITDWFVARERRTELRRIVAGLRAAVADGE